MKPPLWVVQNNLGSLDDVETIGKVAVQIGCDFQGIKVIPFSDDLPDVPNDRPVIFYGSARWTTRIARSGKWIPGVFHDDSVLNVSAYIEHWKEKYINHDSVITTMGRVPDLSYGHDDDIFLRPVYDDKSFAGMVLTFGEAKEWIDKLEGMNDISRDTMVAVATAKNIVSEWRCFVSNGACVAAGQYKDRGRLKQSPGAFQAVIDFAEAAWQDWNLLPIVAIDIALDSDGYLGIMEAGSINATGFYQASIPQVVMAATEQAQNLWTQSKNISKA